VICALARANARDIDQAWGAIKEASHPRIHVFLSTSDIHLTYQLRKTRQEVLRMAVESVTQAKGYTDDVEFSPMDATRTDPEFIFQLVQAVIEAGATTINIPDTVGYAIPDEFGQFIESIINRLPPDKNVILSVHCHDDLGLATANSLEGLKKGARQVECTINGIGERAGNAALEEIVMALKTRSDFFGLETAINTTEIYKTSRW